MDVPDRTTGPVAYDGFISYSHSADDLLAPRLQAGLQKFAKPWWKRRAVRIFRDESSLAANPHLWSSITEALDQSGWFVLLLSPDAAASPWVNQEIAYWVANRDPNKVLPVLTDGIFDWQNGDVSGDAAPDALRGVFAEEPRWVDLRLARTDEHLDLKNPTFSAAVADIASALRGVPKDELESEEVRQHRKTIRTVSVAGLVLLGLAAAATLFALQARTERDRANQFAAVADERSTEANSERDRAIEEAAVAETRRLLAEAASVLETDPQLSMLLSLEAHDGAPERILGDAADAVRRAATANRLLQIVPVAGDGVLAVLAPDANMIYQVSITDNVLSALDLSTGQIEWSVQAAESGWEPAFLSIDADGQLLALSLSARNGQPNRVDVFDTTGQHVHTIHTSGCPIAGAIGPGLSPDGRRLSISDGTPDCDQASSRVRPEADWAVVFETDTWQQEYVYRVDGGHQESVRFTGNSDFMLASYWGNTEVELEVSRYPSLASVATVTNDEDSFAFDERNLVYVNFDVRCREGASCSSYDEALSQVRALNFRTGVTNQLDLSLERHEVYPYRAENVDEGVGENVFLLSPDGTMLSVLWNGPQRVFDTNTGGGLLPTYPPERALFHSWSADSAKLLVAQPDALYLWAVAPGRVTPPGGVAGDWVTYARTAVLVRGLTEAECTVFNIDPCPTLEQMRRR